MQLDAVFHLAIERTPIRRRPRRAGPLHGFTLVELVVASVITTTALLGVYTLLQQSLEAETRAETRWRSRTQAELTASLLVSVLEQGVNLSDEPTVRAGSSPDGAGRLICLSAAKVHTTGNRLSGGFQWMRFEWGQSKETSLGDSQHAVSAKGIVLKMQSVAAAGSVVLSPSREQAQTPGEPRFWTNATPIVLANGLDALEVQFQEINGSGWENSFEGSVGSVMIRIRAKVGEEMVEKIVVPRVNAQ